MILATFASIVRSPELTHAIPSPCTSKLFVSSSPFVDRSTNSLVYAQDKQPTTAGASTHDESKFLTGIRQLTLDGLRSGEGYFSQDGKMLVFQSERESSNPFYQIYLMDGKPGMSNESPLAMAKRPAPGFIQVAKKSSSPRRNSIPKPSISKRQSSNFAKVAKNDVTLGTTIQLTISSSGIERPASTNNLPMPRVTMPKPRTHPTVSGSRFHRIDELTRVSFPKRKRLSSKWTKPAPWTFTLCEPMEAN